MPTLSPSSLASIQELQALQECIREANLMLDAVEARLPRQRGASLPQLQSVHVGDAPHPFFGESQRSGCASTGPLEFETADARQSFFDALDSLEQATLDGGHELADDDHSTPPTLRKQATSRNLHIAGFVLQQLHRDRRLPPAKRPFVSS